LLLSLAGLLVLAFVPLFFAVSELTRSTLQTTREQSARAIGRAAAAHVADARRTRADADLDALLSAEVGSTGLSAIAVYDVHGTLVQGAGGGTAGGTVPQHVPVDTERTRTLQTARGRALEVLIPSEDGPVLAMVRTDDESMRVGPLVRLVGLYTGTFALALLVFAYIALTRLIVRPLDQLGAAVRRVSLGARELEFHSHGARELVELGTDLAAMTRQLRAEEQALRSKICELERATEELRSAQRTLMRSERLASVGRLSAGLAHEIGNPIAAILGFEELLLSGELTPNEQRDFLQRMRRETERINRVLRQLLDFARPAAAPKNASPSSEPGNVREAIEDASALMRPQRSYRDVQLDVDIDQGLPLVKLSREELTQVLVNLLLNATDATGGRGHVWVRATRTGDCTVRVHVADDGPGVPDEMKETIFEPFVTTKDVGQGTGLGLAVCRGLVEASGGWVAVEDAPGGGACFVAELPIAHPLDQQC
jgi:signal transduction histidine kinase